MSMPPDADHVETRAKNIRALILDVDGVLTDGYLHYLPGGAESKTFHVRDGLGIKMLIAHRIRVGIISGRASEMVERRAFELGIEHVECRCLGASKAVGIGSIFGIGEPPVRRPNTTAITDETSATQHTVG